MSLKDQLTAGELAQTLQLIRGQPDVGAWEAIKDKLQRGVAAVELQEARQVQLFERFGPVDSYLVGQQADQGEQRMLRAAAKPVVGAVDAELRNLVMGLARALVRSSGFSAERFDEPLIINIVYAAVKAAFFLGEQHE